MKKLSFFSLLMSIVATQFTSAQEIKIMDPEEAGKLPLNHQVVTGRLDNGLRYYIQPNSKPENKVELRLVVNAGSILETDQQQGLAHFCEHMAFNGTEHFKKNELVDYLQTAGVKFGAHLNAYTSFDETVYMLSLPSDNQELLDKGFLVLEDWSSNLSFDPEEIDKERGVVLEEFRLGLGAQKRMMENYLPIVFKDSRYANRLPIGKEEILKNFQYQTLKDFYKTWYRPNLMAVVVVGDIDPALMEEKIKQHFAKLKNPEKSLDRILYPVPDQNGIDVSINTDPEASYNSMQIFVRQSGEREVEGTEEEFQNGIHNRLIFNIINERLNDIGESSTSPFSYVWMNMGEMWARTKSALQAGAIVTNGKYLESLEVIMTELKRAQIHGFSEKELERAKTRILKSAERKMKEEDKTESNRHAGALVEHFLTGKPVLEPQLNLELTTRYLDEMDPLMLTEKLNQIDISKNLVIVITGIEKERESIPTEHEFMAKMIEVSKAQVDPMEEEVVASSLMERPNTAGKITSTNEITGLDATSITLSNGAKVLYKKTELKNDQILFYAFSNGGSSVYDDATYKKFIHAMSSLNAGGVGNHSKKDLSKILAGKKVSVSPFISSYYEGLNGNCSPEDFEEMMQLVYLYINKPRFDKEAYDNNVQRERSFTDNMLSNPGSYFNQEWSKFVYNDHLRINRIPQAEDWENTSYEVLEKVYRERFSSAAYFTYIFVGNIDEDQLKQMAKTYLGLPGSKANTEAFIDQNVRPRKGTDRLNVNIGSDQKSQVRILFKGETTFNSQEDLHLGMLGEALTIKLTEKLREDMSGVYGSGASGYMSLIPYENYTFSISFPCGPENVEALIAAALGELKTLIDEGPSEKDLNKVKQARLKELETRKQSNRYWLAHLQRISQLGLSVDQAVVTPDEINAVSSEDLKTVAAKYLSGDHLIGVLFPEEAKE